MPLTEPQAKEVWDVLVEDVGASQSPDDRLSFIWYATDPTIPPQEYRFQGNLGFGGKVHFSRQGLHVSCYPEDKTPERLKAIWTANARLAELWETWNGDVS